MYKYKIYKSLIISHINHIISVSHINHINSCSHNIIYTMLEAAIIL